MKIIRAMFLSVNPACLSALVGLLNSGPFMFVDSDTYENYEKRHKKYSIVIYNDDSITDKELKLIKKDLTVNQKTKKILYTSFTDKYYLEFFSLNRINGIVSHRADLTIVKEAIEKIGAGEQYICKDTKSFIIGNKINLEIKRFTNREKEILNLGKLGLSNIKIADKLFISKRTVEKHKWNIKKKISFNS